MAQWEAAIVKSINTFMGLQTGVDARTRLERQVVNQSVPMHDLTMVALVVENKPTPVT